MEYETTDIYLASALLEVGYEMIGIKRDLNHSTRQIFLFNDHDGELNSAVEQFWTDLPVNALSYSQKFQTLKKRIRSN